MVPWCHELLPQYIAWIESVVVSGQEEGGERGGKLKQAELDDKQWYSSFSRGYNFIPFTLMSYVLVGLQILWCMTR